MMSIVHLFSFVNLAGLAPEVIAENDGELPDSDPHWGIDVIFKKNTTLCYGPWVDRQRWVLVNIYLLLTEFEVHTVSYGLSFSRSLMAQARSARAINKRENTRICNLQYGPRKRV